MTPGRGQKTLRALAKGEGRAGRQWRLVWRAAKDAGVPVFPGPVISWDKNKLVLSYWSAIYDNIYQHPKRPPQHIIDDDKRLDEWISQQAQEMEEEARKNWTKQSSGSTNVFDHEDVILFGEVADDYFREEEG